MAQDVHFSYLTFGNLTLGKQKIMITDTLGHITNLKKPYREDQMIYYARSSYMRSNEVRMQAVLSLLGRFQKSRKNKFHELKWGDFRLVPSILLTSKVLRYSGLSSYDWPPIQTTGITIRVVGLIISSL